MSEALRRILAYPRPAVEPPRYVVGIDPGVKTGWAVWDIKDKRLTEVETVSIHEAIFAINTYWGVPRRLVRVVFEDARQRTWFGERGTPAQERAKLQGVGSVKRDCAIWDDFLKSLGIPYVAQAPVAGATKWTDDYFRRITGWKGRTSNHGRDAAALIFGVTR